MKYSELLPNLQNLIGYKPTAKEMADVLNFSSEKVYYTRAQRDSSFSLEEIELLERHYGIDLIGCNNNSTELNYYPNVFGSCGTGLTVFDECSEKISVNKNTIPDYSENAKYSVINAHGSSMQPVLFDNDKVIIKHWQGEQIIDNKIYLFTYKGELFIKRLVKNIDQVLAISEDKTFAPRELNSKDLSIIGRVVSLIRTDL